MSDSQWRWCPECRGEQERIAAYLGSSAADEGELEHYRCRWCFAAWDEEVEVEQETAT